MNIREVAKKVVLAARDLDRSRKYDLHIGGKHDAAFLMSLEFVGPEGAYLEGVDKDERDAIMEYVKWHLQSFLGAGQKPFISVLHWNDPSPDTYSSILVGLKWEGALTLCHHLDEHGGVLNIEVGRESTADSGYLEFELVAKSVSFVVEGEEQEFMLPRSMYEVIDLIEELLGYQ